MSVAGVGVGRGGEGRERDGWLLGGVGGFGLSGLPQNRSRSPQSACGSRQRVRVDVANNLAMVGSNFLPPPPCCPLLLSLSRSFFRTLPRFVCETPLLGHRHFTCISISGGINQNKEASCCRIATPAMQPQQPQQPCSDASAPFPSPCSSPATASASLLSTVSATAAAYVPAFASICASHCVSATATDSSHLVPVYSPPLHAFNTT